MNRPTFLVLRSAERSLALWQALWLLQVCQRSVWLELFHHPRLGGATLAFCWSKYDIRADITCISISTPKHAPSISPTANTITRGLVQKPGFLFYPLLLLSATLTLLSSWTALVPFLFTPTVIVETVIISCLEMAPRSSLVSGPFLYSIWWLYFVPK